MHFLFTQFYNVIGVIGVILTLIGYYYLNVGRLLPESLVYLLLNFVGSCLILFSLMFDWNLSSALIEAAWILISLIGIIRSLKIKKQKSSTKLHVIQSKEKDK